VVFEALARRHQQAIKHTRKREKDVARHYKAEWENLMRRRDAGESGRLEFEGYSDLAGVGVS
jgi:hypothetical protein